MSTNNMWSFELEAKALKTILTPSSPYSGKLFVITKPEFFFHKVTSSLWKRLEELLNSGVSSFPTWEILATDDKIPEDIQIALKEAFAEVPLITTEGDFEYVQKELVGLAAKRLINKTLYETQDILFDKDKSPEEALGKIGDALSKIQITDNFESELFMGFGYNEQAEKVFHEIVFRPGTFQFVETGYPSFDKKSGGHQRGNLVVIGAGSGGGKSLYAVNLLVRQFLKGYNVVLASYEMNYHEILIRILSIISQVEMQRIQLNMLTPEEVVTVECAWREFNLQGIKNKNYFNLVCPTGETTVSDIGLRFKGKNVTSIIFDYINLLTSKSEFSDSQWQMLGEIAREGKKLAVYLNCVVYLLAQLDDSLNLRYSKAIRDHANWIMGWNRDQQSIIDGYVTVKQLKARNAPLYDYPLLTKFNTATFGDPEDPEVTKEYSDADRKRLLKEAKKHGVFFPIVLEGQELKVKKTETLPSPPLKIEAKPVVNLTQVERSDSPVSYYIPDDSEAL